MIIDTAHFKSLPRLLSATLSESAENVSTLDLVFSGWDCADYAYMQPLTLMHKGAPLFHGKISSISCANDGGEKTTRISASNFIWILDHQTAASQIAELKNSQKNSTGASIATDGNTLRGAMQQTLSSWEKVAAACKMSAEYWGVYSTGAPRADTVLTVDTSRATYTCQPVIEKNKTYTAWQALTIMKESNPDALFIARPSGVLEVVSLKKADTLTWDTSLISSISDILPCYEDAIAGVAVCVTYQDSTTGKLYTKTLTYPVELDLDSANIRVFSATVDKYSRLQAQANHLLNQARAYFLAVNELQWSGSISTRIDKVSASPLGARLNISGAGAHPDWATMLAPITACEWDFLSGELTLTLGMQIDTPTLHEITWNDNSDGGGGENESSGGQSSIPYYSRSKDDSTASNATVDLSESGEDSEDFSRESSDPPPSSAPDNSDGTEHSYYHCLCYTCANYKARES